MRIIALANHKGGVGKTTCAINIGAGLQRMGKEVLLIDLDPMAALTDSLGIEEEDINATVTDLISGAAGIGETIIDRNGLKVIPSDDRLVSVELELSAIGGEDSVYALREGMKQAEKIADFDYAIMDCPPGLGYITVNALATAMEVFIPLQTEYLALRMAREILDTIEDVKDKLNFHLEVTGIIATMFDQRKNLNKEALEQIRNHFGKRVFKTVIRSNVALAEAPSHGNTIYEYRPRSYGAEDYTALCREIARRR